MTKLMNIIHINTSDFSGGPRVLHIVCTEG